jgi:secondary thiamine-phosphate synthase enzyme
MARPQKRGSDSSADFHFYHLENDAAMTSYTDYLTIRTSERYDIRDITDEVERVRAHAQLRDGFVLVSTMHITSSIFVNDHEPGLYADIMTWLEGLAPFGQDYRHHLTGEDNADAHLKRMILGHQVLVPVTNGALDLGPWERVHYGEFDGRRDKRVLLKAFGLGGSAE